MRARWRRWARPVPARMPEVALTELPPDWTTREIAREVAFAEWCKRPETPDCEALDEAALEVAMDSADFTAEWRERRETYLRTLRKPILAGVNLHRAKLRKAHLPGIDFRGAILTEIDGSEAQMEGANLGEAQIQGAYLIGAQMQGAYLIGAQMQGAYLIGAQMQGADLRGARMQGADLREAQMQGADLGWAQMQGADLRGARMQGADLREAQMQGADLGYSLLTGTPDALNLVQSTNLSASTSDGGALRFVDLTTAVTAYADLRNSFADGSVKLAVGVRRPCQWRTESITSDDEFYGRWRGWVEASPNASPNIWRGIAPEDFEDVPAIPPPAGCEWKTGQLPHGP